MLHFLAGVPMVNALTLMYCLATDSSTNKKNKTRLPIKIRLNGMNNSCHQAENLGTNPLSR